MELEELLMIDDPVKDEIDKLVNEGIKLGMTTESDGYPIPRVYEIEDGLYGINNYTLSIQNKKLEIGHSGIKTIAENWKSAVFYSVGYFVKTSEEEIIKVFEDPSKEENPPIFLIIKKDNKNYLAVFGSQEKLSNSHLLK